LENQKIYLSAVQWSHITAVLNSLELLLMGRHNHIDHVLIDKRHH